MIVCRQLNLAGFLGSERRMRKRLRIGADVNWRKKKIGKKFKILLGD